jgi:hypothetical protein
VTARTFSWTAWSVLDGQVRFRLGNTEHLIGSADGEMVALRLQAFLEESAAAAREGLFTARGLPHGLGGARWAANFLERYRGETVLLKPPQPVQRALIALLARDSSPRGGS